MRRKKSQEFLPNIREVRNYIWRECISIKRKVGVIASSETFHYHMEQ